MNNETDKRNTIQQLKKHYSATNPFFFEQISNESKTRYIRSKIQKKVHEQSRRWYIIDKKTCI